MLKIIKTEEIEENGNKLLIETYSNGTVVKSAVSDPPTEGEEPQEPEPTQLDRIEAMVAKDNETIAQEAVDAYTMELIEEGVL